ncbi:gamma-glutamyltransferase [Qipengyuania sp. GH38]|uniref:gamma-glutamyltransferase n=1 Tax=Qipengyuania intermedia TaxID=2867244 RepID=UPI001C876FCD|nr:gamma-glutamyltransferase [Qipengyuania intermedia]MBX7513983.1 gamma-glutamyltransferase [Qipengyuania intermedia]
MKKLFITSLASFSLAGCATYTAPISADSADYTRGGAVSAADPRAQEAGEAILAKGGSATDAAIAVMLALTVVEPQSSGIGGGGFLVRGEPDGDVTTFDGRETAPAAAQPDWFLDANGEVPPFMQSVRSGLSVGVPGNIALAAKAHAAHGRLDWATLFDPAIALAREGFQINPRMHDALGRSKDRAAFSAEARALFYDPSGEPLPVGTLVRNEALARTFEALASGGRDAFYSGPRALAIATTVAADTPKPAAMTYEDIAGYEAKEREAVCSTYRAYRVCSMGPPTSGGVAVQQMLMQLERFDLAALGAENPVTWHLFLESQRLAYADREIYLADADFVSVPVDGLLDRKYLAGRSALISPERSMEEALPGTPPGAMTALADGDEPEEHGTSHFAVVDSTNTMVSYTSTIEGAFGSGLMVDGFYLNNELTDFSRSPVVDGREVANRVEGGKRPRSSMSPTVIYDPQGRPFMAVGAAGGSTIPVTTARAIIGAIDFGLSVEDALRLPFLMAFGDRVMLEKGTWLETKADAFRALGHEELVMRQAPIKAGALLYRAGEWHSARDPRLEGFVDMP